MTADVMQTKKEWFESLQRDMKLETDIMLARLKRGDEEE